MQATAELVLFPWGLREGMPVMALDVVGDGDLPTTSEVKAALSRIALPAAATNLWLRTIPWGSELVDRRVAEWTYALPETTVVATATAEATQWSNLQNVSWVLDCTALVEKPTTASGLRALAVARSTRYLPLVDEIVATRIDSGNLLAAPLQALANMWQCNAGMIYVRPEQVAAATVAVAGAGMFAARVRA